MTVVETYRIEPDFEVRAIKDITKTIIPKEKCPPLYLPLKNPEVVMFRDIVLNEVITKYFANRMNYLFQKIILKHTIPE
jgi:hypothetical protein